MKQDRREFLRTMMAGAGWGLLGGCATTQQSCQQQIANRPMRRNVNTMAASDPILVAYKAAITAMKALPPSDPRNWTRQAQIHNNFCPHGNWLFLPWHRVYLFYFERICRKLSGMADFALPYWNWSQDARIPATFWGNASNPLFNGTRAITASSTLGSSVSAATVNGILDEPNFLLFASGAISATASQRANGGYGRLEQTPHNSVHGFVGGDMGSFLSPLDPIFWMHHNNIERLWVQWQFDRDHVNTDDQAWLRRQFNEFCDENGNAVSTQVVFGLLYPVLSYRYDDAGPGSSASDVADSSKAAEERNSRKAKAGAKVMIDVRRRFPLSERLLPTIERASTRRVAVAAQALEGVGNGSGDAPRALLTLSGASPGHTEDFFVRVFLNKPDATADTPESDPHFAGTFAFFSHVMPGHDHGTPDFTLDVSAVARRLQLTGGDVDVTVVLVPYPDRQLKTSELTFTTTELKIARDVITRTP
jgi:tyrosinase